MTQEVIICIMHNNKPFSKSMKIVVQVNAFLEAEASLLFCSYISMAGDRSTSMYFTVTLMSTGIALLPASHFFYHLLLSNSSFFPKQNSHQKNHFIFLIFLFPLSYTSLSSSNIYNIWQENKQTSPGTLEYSCAVL